MEKDSRYLETVPVQVQGSQMDIVEERCAHALTDAIALFERAGRRLLSVNQWGEYAGISAFQLIDCYGIRAEREAQEGDYIRIDIPGPGTAMGMGYDWVKIEEIIAIEEAEEQVLSMTVRPCGHPISEREETAHFLTRAATSTFIIRRTGLCVAAEEHGRNEMPNTAEGSFFDKSRNFIVGMAAKLGLSYPQWKSLTKGLLRD